MAEEGVELPELILFALVEGVVVALRALHLQAEEHLGGLRGGLDPVLLELAGEEVGRAVEVLLPRLVDARGADIQTDEAVEVVNKDLVLATLTDDVPFELEMVVENGRGYVPASEHSPDAQEIGSSPVDAVFSPVTRVRYEVEETRVGQKTNYDKLTMEIWTDGTVTPEMALVEAAKILRKHLNPFVGYTQQGPAVSLPPVIDWTKLKPGRDTVLGWDVQQLELSVRAQNCLVAAGIRKVSDLVALTREQVLEMRNAGDQTAEEIEAKLAEHDLKLGMSPVEA